jgi:hypothetical protein
MGRAVDQDAPTVVEMDRAAPPVIRLSTLGFEGHIAWAEAMP